jgi:hypothetical protein
LLGQQITKGALLFCIGILLFEGGLIWHLFVQKDRCGFEGRGDYLRAVFLALFIILLTYAGLAVLALIDKVSFLEVTWAFWIALAVLATIGSLLCFWLGTRKICPNWIRAALKFQLSKHPSGFLRLSRVARMHLLFTIGFLWWNLALAPAIYGNATAREYLHAAHARFVKKADGTPRPYKLQTLYAAPANDLERDRERYFLFYPIRDDQSIAVSSLKTRLDNDVRKRWSVFPSSEGDDHMKQVVFASGSPFPIFSPHQVKPRAGEPEWLVDGGFAHNIPLEAAKEIGARQVLLLNSSPADSFEASGSLLEHLGSALGQLPQGIPRLLPFLFRRSQVADLLIREQMFVVCLSPLPEKDWPSLVDFRRTVVQRLLNTAADHTHQRIGHIETAGPPVFLISVRMGRGESLPSLGGE